MMMSVANKKNRIFPKFYSIVFQNQFVVQLLDVVVLLSQVGLVRDLESFYFLAQLRHLVLFLCNLYGN
jgi:hypothetical protein